MTARNEGARPGPLLPEPPAVPGVVCSFSSPPHLCRSAGVAGYLLCSAWIEANRQYAQGINPTAHALAGAVWCLPSIAEEVQADAETIAAMLEARRPKGPTASPGGFRVSRMDGDGFALIVLCGAV